MDGKDSNLSRYERQIAFGGLGLAGQRAIGAARAMIVGVGGLGSWTAELLTRAGVGALRLVDDDRVDLTNIHRQALYDEEDAAAKAPKVEAAARRLGRINAGVAVEPAFERLAAANIERLAAGAHVILDGTDNFATRFLINDFAVKRGVPWVMAGVVAAEAQVMAVLPGRTACLRCLMPAPPPPCTDPSCRVAGVLGPAVAAVAAMQAGEAMKLLAGRSDLVSPYLTKFDLWGNALQRIRTDAARKDDCPCCGQKCFEFLEP